MPQIDAEFKKTETYKELMSTLDSSIEEVENRVTDLTGTWMVGLTRLLTTWKVSSLE